MIRVSKVVSTNMLMLCTTHLWKEMEMIYYYFTNFVAGISNPQKIEVGKLRFKNNDKLIHLFVGYNEGFVSEKMIFKCRMFHCHDWFPESTFLKGFNRNMGKKIYKYFPRFTLAWETQFVAPTSLWRRLGGTCIRQRAPQPKRAPAAQ